MTELFDVAVVGSGPLGVAAARRLAEIGAQVLVLEQGEAITDPPGAHLRNADQFHQQPDNYLPEAMKHLEFIDDSLPRGSLPGAAVTRAVGGQGAIWTNLCPRGDALWPVMSDGAWAECYAMAEAYLAVQTDRLDRSVRQQRIGKELESFAEPTGREVAALPVAGQYIDDAHLHYIGPHDILKASTAGKNVSIRHDRVSRIVVEGHRISHLETASGRVEAESYVIAGGAIGTPELLFRSGIRPHALGRYLSYHPLAVCQVVVAPDFCAADGVADIAPRLQIRPSKAAPWYTILLRDVSPFTPSDGDAEIADERLVEIQSICPVDIEEHKRAIFGEGSVTFDVALSKADLARMARAEEEAHVLTSLIGRFREGCAPIWMPFGFAHMTGTTRMSAENDGTGVADYQGRVWDHDNLFLATNGLIPTRMSVNPTLTGVSLAIHIANQI
ncbi:FAD-dependent oxidoreductase [Rhodobacteraceae bacterium NNCM2]|nr:FAD-dependent oxidoreductase [Coraliihabitans acroporae]